MATQVEDPTPTEPKKPRRRFTPEERIANRKAEIERIEMQRRDRIRERIDEAKETLRVCAMDATAAGMEQESERCSNALQALNGVG